MRLAHAFSMRRLCVIWVIGVGCASCVKLPGLADSTASICSVTAGIVLLTTVWICTETLRYRLWAIQLVTVLTALAWGMSSRTTVQTPSVENGVHTATQQVEATVADVPLIHGGRFRTVLSHVIVHGQAWDKQTRLWLSTTDTTSLHTIRYGDIVRVSGMVTLPAQALNPGQFDQSTYLRSIGVTTVLLSQSPSSVHVVEHASPNLYGITIAPVRAWIAAGLQEALPKDEGELAEALLFGMPGTMDPSTAQAFSLLGVLHVLIASGLKVRMTLRPIEWFLRSIHVPRTCEWIIVGVMVSLYIGVVGGGVAVWRAAIAVMLERTAQSAGRRSSPWTSLWLAAAICASIEPLGISSPGFVLSFGVTAGLLMFSYRAAHLCRHVLPRVVANHAGNVIIAELISGPLVAEYFHQFSLLAIPANAYAIGYLVIAIPVGLLFVLFSVTVGRWMPEWMTGASHVFSGMLHLLTDPMAWIAQKEILSWNVASPSIVWLIVYYVVLTMSCGFGFRMKLFIGHPLYLLLRSRVPETEAYTQLGDRMELMLRSASFPIFLFATVLHIMFIHGITRATYLSTGRAPDWAFFQTKQGYTLLCAGQSSSPSFTVDQVVIPALRASGVNHVDVLFLPSSTGSSIAEAIQLARVVPVVEVIAPTGRGAQWTALSQHVHRVNVLQDTIPGGSFTENVGDLRFRTERARGLVDRYAVTIDLGGTLFGSGTTVDKQVGSDIEDVAQGAPSSSAVHQHSLMQEPPRRYLLVDEPLSNPLDAKYPRPATQPVEGNHRGVHPIQLNLRQTGALTFTVGTTRLGVLPFLKPTDGPS